MPRRTRLDLDLDDSDIVRSARDRETAACYIIIIGNNLYDTSSVNGYMVVSFFTCHHISTYVMWQYWLIIKIRRDHDDGPVQRLGIGITRLSWHLQSVHYLYFMIQKEHIYCSNNDHDVQWIITPYSYCTHIPPSLRW